MKPRPDADRIHITDDGNQRLTVVEQAKRALMSDNPRDFPTLTAAHLTGIPEAAVNASAQVARMMDSVMSRDLRARAVGAATFKRLRDSNVILLYDVYLLQRKGFVQLMKETERPDSLAAGLTDKEYELSWEVFEHNMQLLAKAGRLRKRKDWRG